MIRPDQRRRRAGATGARAGFTLLELMIVMVILGIVAGLAVAGYDRVDPGYRGLRAATETFLETSRDRARASGHPVVVRLVPGSEDGAEAAHLERMVYRRVLEATFEATRTRREGIELYGAAEGGVAGRYGAGVDLRAGGGVAITGRGALARFRRGFSLEFDVFDEAGASAPWLAWRGFLYLRRVQGGRLELELRAGDEESMADVRALVPPGHLRSGVWQHVRVDGGDGELAVFVDGDEALRMEIPPRIGDPADGPVLGDPEDDEFRGLFDEFAAWTRVAEDGVDLPTDVELVLPVDEIVLDRHGMLHPRVHAEPVPVRLMEFEREIASFLVGRFTQEAMP